MDQRVDPLTNRVSDEFFEGVNVFIEFACNQASYQETNTILCPCARCKNGKQRDAKTVIKHLSRVGFKGNYYVWLNHGEQYYDVGESSRTSHFTGEEATWPPNSTNFQVPENPYEYFPYGNANIEQEMEAPHVVENMMETTNEEPYHDSVFEAFEAAKEPLYDGCPEGISQLYLSSRMLKAKSDYNMVEACVDELSQTFKAVLPTPNKAPASYYETKKLTQALGLPVYKIDVCENNCMLFWKGEDGELLRCRFCDKDRYHPHNGKGKKRPKQRMFYMPITDRLKRLYQLENTATAMRWHAEHMSPEGEMHHPSDGAAWKHFNEVYPNFAAESRNIYLGLSTDGFNPVGMNGEAHSVWPVIVTPYNLPPGMCMKREFFFLSVLVPGPKHPKKSLDIYLQPLIEELQSLWIDGAEAYDVSKKQKFTMRAALMWTISDFPAYGMLSGWMTHGRLSCPYCLDDTKSFWLPNGRKHSWFDCHRMFLPQDHPYRKNVQAFRGGKEVRDDPPPWLTGEEILYERINNIRGLFRTVDCGGNGHEKPAQTIDGYGVDHNWVKKSILWELPYWENLLLRHNLDFMHTEKNFLDNLINTVLNVPGKTKDNIKSRMDLPALCRRRDLHLTRDGIMPVPIFRLSNEKKRAFLLWMKNDIRFPDGYASKFSRCVDKNHWKLSGLKSHDCHVIMQRLLPFAFAELLPKSIHTAISAKILRKDDVALLKANIAVKLCNLEKIFPPSFFDVMEHLPVHLPDEAALGGPVQYRWMYPFERYMYHLKRKVKNKAHIAGSIVAQCVNEEIANASANYFGHPEVRDDVVPVPGEIRFTYFYPDVPSLFYHEGRVSGKATNGWFNDQDYTVLQTFLLLNCDTFEPYERWFDTTIGRGIRKHPSGIIDVAPRRHYEKYGPFILSGNCDQVCFIPYPRVRHTVANDWWACTKVMPRGVRETAEDALIALQDDTHNHFVAPSTIVRIESHVVEDDADYDILHVAPPNDEYISEEELEDSCDDSDSASDSGSE
ncbi:Transposon En/Spm-like [Arabidopsis suecica]|uniref:Transposon En/Spm-like n=1 Tax=Arabidopsis suecica TaxID=45249 RepID=A0A8T1XYE0_ARASU|nr:Transposon En/Spm-like [Arabidopsis suecica]